MRHNGRVWGTCSLTGFGDLFEAYEVKCSLSIGGDPDWPAFPDIRERFYQLAAFFMRMRIYGAEQVFQAKFSGEKA